MTYTPDYNELHTFVRQALDDPNQVSMDFLQGMVTGYQTSGQPVPEILSVLTRYRRDWERLHTFVRIV
jgi:hypothetical protein